MTAANAEDESLRSAAKPTVDEKVRNSGKSRVQFDLSPRAMELLTELKEKTEAPSYAEVFKNAMKLYAGLIEEVERGSEFMLKDKDGRIGPFKIFL
jgi:hypothetical protein